MSRKFIPLLLVIFLLVGGGYWWWWHQGRIDTDNAYIKADILPVMSRISGSVQEVPGPANRAVTKGELLVALDPAIYLSRVAQQQAVLASANANLVHLQDRLAAQQALIAAASAGVAGAEAELKRARQQQTRLQELRRQQYVAEDNLDAAASAVQASEARLQQTSAQLLAQQANLASIEGERAGLMALRDQAAAALQLAQLDLEYCQIRAARDGVISSQQVQVGQTITPATRLMSLVTAPVWVEANFKETQLAAIQIGQRAELEVDGREGSVLTGTVESFSGATGSEFALLPPQNATGNFTKVVQRVPVRIRINEGQDVSLLRPGMSVVVTIHSEQ